MSAGVAALLTPKLLTTPLRSESERPRARESPDSSHRPGILVGPLDDPGVQQGPPAPHEDDGYINGQVSPYRRRTRSSLVHCDSQLWVRQVVKGPYAFSGHAPSIFDRQL